VGPRQVRCCFLHPIACSICSTWMYCVDANPTIRDPGWLSVASILLHRRRSMTDIVPMLFRFSVVFYSFFFSFLASFGLKIHCAGRYM